MEWLILVVAVVVIAAVAAYVILRQRSAALSRRFGPEYDRAVDEHGSRRAGEAELRRLEERRDALDLRELDPVDRKHYVEQWSAVQLRFVDEPEATVAEADDLVVQVMAARGYPVDDPDERTGMVVADHPELAGDYRAAHAIRRRSDEGAASLDELREGFRHYRELFSCLLADAAGDREDPDGGDRAGDAEGIDRDERAGEGIDRDERAGGGRVVRGPERQRATRAEDASQWEQRAADNEAGDHVTTRGGDDDAR
jgi:hypothetical protein